MRESEVNPQDIGHKLPADRAYVLMPKYKLNEVPVTLEALITLFDRQIISKEEFRKAMGIDR